jgi:hypothetical protein
MFRVFLILLAISAVAFCSCKDKGKDPYIPPAMPPTSPDKVASPNPADGATDVSVTTDLSWGAAAGADSYDIYFGTDQSVVAAADTSSPEFAGNQAGLTYDPGTLDYSTTYYWRVDSVNTAGTTGGDVWSFTTETAPLSPPSQVTGPSPSDGALDVPVTTDLGWTAAARAGSYHVYFGTDQAMVAAADTGSPEFRGSVTDLTFNLGTLDYSTTYYWRVDSVNAAGTTKGNVWSFTTEPSLPPPPDKVAGPSPADGAPDVPLTTDLGWGAAARADSYDVYIGTDQSAITAADTGSPEFMGNLTDLTYDPGTLDYSTTYYWRIDSVNTAGTTPGDVWSFTTEASPTTPPDKVTGPSPADASTDVPVTTDLGWTAAASADSYDVYFGTVQAAVAAATTTSAEFMGNQTDLTYDPGSLAYSTTYYWRVDSVNAVDTTVGDVWSFTTEATPTTPPDKVTGPDPPDAAVDVIVNIDLGWTAAARADSYDVYFDADQTAVTNANTSTPGIYRGNQTELTYNPGILENSTTYYWRVDSVNTAGTTKGDTWSFTTGDEPPTTGDLFGQPIQTDEIIFVIDRTGSMTKTATITIEDENGNPVVNPLKIEVARIGTVKSIMGLDEDAKFAIVGFSTGNTSGATIDTNWVSDGTSIGGHWSAWPPAQGEPAPLGYHQTALDNTVVYPASKQMVRATDAEKTAAIAWCNQRFTSAESSGGTCTYDGMSEALKMVIPPPPGPGTSDTCVYLLTDGSPSFINGLAYSLIRFTAPPDGMIDATWVQPCMDLTKSKILSENIRQARIFTAGLGMNDSCANAYVWNPAKNDWDFYPTEYNNRCRQFLSELAAATGGTYNEICP